MTRRACKECGAYLRMSNSTDYCWPCRPHDVEGVEENTRRYNQPWTADEAIEALKKWTDWMGRPPLKIDWEKSARADEPDHPTAFTVYRLFANWAEFLQAADLRPNIMTRKDRGALVLAALPATTREVEKVVGITLNGTRSLLKRMRDDGLIYLDKDKVWHRVEAQEEAA